MLQIRSNVAIARESVKTFIDLDISKIDIDFLNVVSFVKIAQLNNDLGKLIFQFNKDVENLDHLVIDIDNRKGDSLSSLSIQSINNYSLDNGPIRYNLRQKEDQ